jgi:hypothetical protein
MITETANHRASRWFTGLRGESPGFAVVHQAHAPGEPPARVVNVIDGSKAIGAAG